MKLAKTALLAVLLTAGLACGYSSKATTPATAGAMPNITALAPNSANSPGAAFVLTVNGTNFNSNAVINWAGAAQTTSFVSAGQLTATISAPTVTAVRHHSEAGSACAKLPQNVPRNRIG